MSELIQNLMFGFDDPTGRLNRARNAITVPAELPHSDEAMLGPQLIQLFVPGTKPHGWAPAR